MYSRKKIELNNQWWIGNEKINDMTEIYHHSISCKIQHDLHKQRIKKHSIDSKVSVQTNLIYYHSFMSIQGENTKSQIFLSSNNIFPYCLLNIKHLWLVITSAELNQTDHLWESLVFITHSQLCLIGMMWIDLYSNCCTMPPHHVSDITIIIKALDISNQNVLQQLVQADDK